MGIHLHARGPRGACGEAAGSAVALPFVEDFGLPSRCHGGLGHGEDALQEGGSQPHGRSWTYGPDRKEIPVSLVYGQVELAANYSQQDCRLDHLLDGIEEEFNQSN